MLAGSLVPREGNTASCAGILVPMDSILEQVLPNIVLDQVQRAQEHALLGMTCSIAAIAVGTY